MSVMAAGPRAMRGVGRVRLAFERIARIPLTARDVLAQYKSQELADAAFPEHARRGGRKAQEYRTFQRSLQRWRLGLSGSADKQARRPGAASSARLLNLGRMLAMRRMLRAAERDGVTLIYAHLWIVVSEPHEEERHFQGPNNRVGPGPLLGWAPPGDLRAQGFFPAAYAEEWEDAAEAFFRAWFDAYGIGTGVVVTEVVVLTLKAGRP